MKNENLNISNKQYLEILHKIKNIVNKDGFVPYIYDSETIGNKYTESNCGFCNDMFVTKDNSLWPEQFPKRKSMKYRAGNHPCPFDKRFKGNEEPELILGFGFGCFYHCMLVRNPKVGCLKKAVDKTLEYANKMFDKSGEDTIERCEEAFVRNKRV